jgi:hypothetical protein
MTGMTQKQLVDYNRERQKTEYLIDREGKIQKYKGKLNIEIISMHTEIECQFYPEARHHVVDDLGWITIGSTMYNYPVIKIEPTQAQINTLDQLDLLDRLHILDNGYYVFYIKEK